MQPKIGSTISTEPSDNIAVEEAGDKTSFEAVTLAVWKYTGRAWCKAELRWEHGLVLTDDQGMKVHFRTPKAGYDGQGSRAAAAILEVFGFGGEDELLAQLTVGGVEKLFTFDHPTNHLK